MVLLVVVSALVWGGGDAKPNLVHNGSFAQGLSGWGTPGSGERLTLTSPGRTDRHAALLSSSSSRARLEDERRIVAAVGSGNTFRAAAWVRASTAGVEATLEVAETSRGTTYRSTTRLAPGRWTRVRLITPVLVPGTGLELGLTTTGLQARTKVEVDDVVFFQLSGDAAATPSALASTTAARTGPPSTVRVDTLFGTSLSTNGRTIGEAIAGEEAKFGSVPVARVFDPGPPPRDSWTRRDLALAGKSVVTSFRSPPAAVLAGAIDDDLEVFFRTAPRDQDVYWSYNHEPEPEIMAGRYTAEEFRRAWRHIDAIARATGNPRLHATLILTGFTADPVSGRDWRTYFAGRDWVDVLAWDVYNNANGTPTTYGDPASTFGAVVAASRASGLPFAIAEMGSARTRDDPSGAARAEWLRRCGEYLRAQGAVFVTYFDSLRDGDFLLDDPASIAAWQALVQVS